LNSKRFALILEDCSKYTGIDLIKGMNYEQTKIAVTSLAKFHSRWWNANDFYSFKWIPEHPKSLYKGVYEQFERLWDLVKQKEDFKSDLPVRLSSLVQLRGFLFHHIQDNIISSFF